MSLDTTMIDEDKYKGTATLVYALYALSFLLGITYIFGGLFYGLLLGWLRLPLLLVTSF